MGNTESMGKSNVTGNMADFVNLEDLSRRDLEKMSAVLANFFNVMNVLDTWTPAEGSSDAPEDVEGALRLVDPYTTEVWTNYTKVVAMYNGGNRERIQKRLKKLGVRLFGLRPTAIPQGQAPELFETLGRIVTGAAYVVAHHIKEVSTMVPGSTEAREAMLVLYQAYEHNKMEQDVVEEADLCVKAVAMLFKKMHMEAVHYMATLGKYLIAFDATYAVIELKPKDTLTEIEQQVVALTPKFDELKHWLEAPETIPKITEMHGPLLAFKKLMEDRKLKVTGIALDADAIPIEEHMRVRQVFCTLINHRVPQALVDRAFGGEIIPSEEVPALPEDPSILSSHLKDNFNVLTENEGCLMVSWFVEIRYFLGQNQKLDVIMRIDAEGGCAVRVEPADETACIAASPNFVAAVSQQRKVRAVMARRVDALTKAKKVIKAKKVMHYGRVGALSTYRRAHHAMLGALAFGTFEEFQTTLEKMKEVALAYIESQPRSAHGSDVYKQRIFMGAVSISHRRTRGNTMGVPPGMFPGMLAGLPPGMPPGLLTGLPPHLVQMYLNQQ